MIPMFWILLGEAKNHTVLMSSFTGEGRVLER